MKFADKLKTILAEQGISQSELSRRVGLNRTIISDYIHGKYEAKADNLKRIAEVLNVSPYVLMSDMDSDVPFELSEAKPTKTQDDFPCDLFKFIFQGDNEAKELLGRMKITPYGSITRDGIEIDENCHETIHTAAKALLSVLKTAQASGKKSARFVPVEN